MHWWSDRRRRTLSLVGGVEWQWRTPKLWKLVTFTSRAPRRPDPGTVRLAAASLPHRPERETKDQINERPRHGPRRVGGPAARRRQEDARAEMERACN